MNIKNIIITFELLFNENIIMGKSKYSGTDVSHNGGHQRNIPLFPENQILLKKFVFHCEAAKMGITILPIPKGIIVPDIKRMSERQVMNWIYANHFPKDAKDFEKIPLTIFSNFSNKTKAITKAAFSTYEKTYVEYLTEKGEEPHTTCGNIRKYPIGCLQPIEFHNLFLIQFFNKQMDLGLFQ